MKKKIVLTVLLGMLIAVGVYFIITEIISIRLTIKDLENHRQDFDTETINFFIKGIVIQFFRLFFILLTCSAFVVNLVFIFKGTKLFGKIEYSLEDYRKEKKEKAQKRQQVKKDKLQKKLDELNKD